MKLNIGIRSFFYKVAFIGLALGLQACGGGGGAAPNAAPVASAVSITDSNGGTIVVGVTLTANYTYTDAESNAEGTSTFIWLRDGTAISGATASTYPLVAADSGKLITLSVTPVASAGTTTGTAVVSTGVTVVNSAPTVSGVSITDNNAGNVEFGDTLTATYTYNDLDEDAEATTFSWLRNGSAISGETASTYTVTTFDAVDLITVEITPVATSGVLTGNPVVTSAITIVDYSKKLNDTGITTCGDYAYTDGGTYAVTGSGTHNNGLDCATQPTVPTKTTDGFDADGDIIRAGQDVFYGRDSTDNDDTDGHAGFSFTKLDTNGVALTNQTVAWNAAGSEATFDQWSCVQDNVTGLIWEVKTTTDLHNASTSYTWYNSTGINDGGEHGVGDTGNSTTTGFENIGGVFNGSDACFDSSRCDTEKFVEDVNTAGLCGNNDWRMPTVAELVSLTNENNIQGIDTNYFPNVVNMSSAELWTSSSQAEVAANEFAWFVTFANVTTSGNADPDDTDKSVEFSVRLVRGN